MGVPTPEAATFQKNLYVKMKEFGPLGGGAGGAPGSANAIALFSFVHND